LVLKTEKKLWPLAQAENCRLALGLKRLDTPGVTHWISLVCASLEGRDVAVYIMLLVITFSC